MRPSIPEPRPADAVRAVGVVGRWERPDHRSTPELATVGPMATRVPRGAARQPKRPASEVLIVPALLVAWTVVVWATRIRNIVGDADLTGTDRSIRILLAVVLVVLGVVAGVALWSNRPQVRWVVGMDGIERLLVPRRLRQSVGVLAVVGGLVWAVRGVQIALADHEIGFIVVHSLLALVTIALSAGAVWSLRPREAPGPAATDAD